MCDWSSAPLATLLEPDRKISYGIVQPGMHVADGVPIVRVRDIRDGRIDTSDPLRVSPEVERAYERTRLKGGELLLTLVGTVGESAVVGKELAGWNTARAVAVIPVCNDVGAYWVKLSLTTHEVRGIIDSRLNTTVQATLNLRDVAKLPILLPPKATRQHIAHILGTLDDKIELNRRMNRTLEAIARAIFKSWFVDFAPVHAKAEGREPVGMDPETAALFPDSLQESLLGWIPKGWEVCELRDLLDLSRESVKPQEHPTEEFDHFSIPAYDAGNPAWELGETIRSSKYLVPPSAVLVSKLNPHIPRVWLPNVSVGRRPICSTEFLVCTPRGGVSREYLYSLLSSSAFLDGFAQMVTGTTGSHQRVRPAAFVAMRMMKPSLELMATFTKCVRPLLLRCSGHLREAASLASARDLLLPRLFSGGLSLSEGDTDG